MQLKFHRFKFEVIDQLVNGKWVASQVIPETFRSQYDPNLQGSKGLPGGCSYRVFFSLVTPP